MKIYLKKSGYALRATDEEACTWLAKINEGELVLCDIKRSRNYENHKRFFRFVQLAFDMQDHFSEQEAFRRWLQMEAGYFSTIVSPNGDVKFVADSIAFDRMDEEEFKIMFSAAIDVFLRELGTGLDEVKLMQIIHFG